MKNTHTDNTQQTGISREILKEISIRMNNLTNNIHNSYIASKHKDTTATTKYSIPKQLPLPECSKLVKVPTSKPIEAMLKPIHCCKTIYWQLPEGNMARVPVFDDNEVGFGKEYEVHEASMDDDQQTSKKLVTLTRESVNNQINDVLCEINDVGFEKFDKSLYCSQFRKRQMLRYR